MEKNNSGNRQLKRILVTGPESTGKTELVKHLAHRFGGISVEEYARGYVEQLEDPYTYDDVEHIARWQDQEYRSDRAGHEWIFFDTWLIITRVWFDVVFGRIPDWLDSRIRASHFDLVLLCAPDIPWVPDSVRENGGLKREILFERYKKELDSFSIEWELVVGTGTERIRMAEEMIIKKLQYGTV